MKKDLILGILDNYTFQQVKKFVFSINKTDFKGDVCLFIGPKTSPYTISMLKKHGMRLEYFKGLDSLPDENLAANEFPLRQPINYFNYRHYLYYDFLLRNRDVYENVLLTDVRDVYFQDNPFGFEIRDSLYCALEGHGSTIKTCSFNGPWMRYIYGERVLDEIGHNFISCAGTTWGKIETIIKYLRSMLAEIQKVPDAKIAIDQAIHNYMIYTGQLNDVVFLKNDGGVVLTLSYEKNYIIDNSQKVLVQGNKLVKVLHQFNRYPDLEALTNRIFLANAGTNFIKHKFYKADLLFHKLLVTLKIRRPGTAA